MDNVSHTLAGVLAAEAFLTLRRRHAPVSPAFATTAWVASAVANNFPDFDFVYPSITGGTLGYLLHHRGHTHTVVFALLASLLGCLGLRALAKAKTWQWSPWDWRVLDALVFLGPLLHLGLDSTNNYGVHPFWPLDNRWFNADAVFIIEPLFWAAVIPTVMASVNARVARILWSVPLVGILVVAWMMPFVPVGHAAFVTFLAGMMFVVARASKAELRVPLSIGISVAVFALFLLTGARARDQLQQQLAGTHVGAKLTDTVLTPLPINPWCWEVTAVLVDEASDTYAARRGTVAPFPSLRSAIQCPTFIGEEGTTAKLRLLEDEKGTAALVWRDEWKTSFSDMKQRIAASCHAQAFMRFARVPFLAELPTAESGRTTSVIGDLRYDRSPELDFAEIELDANTECPKWVPPWTPRRSELVPTSMQR